MHTPEPYIRATQTVAIEQCIYRALDHGPGQSIDHIFQNKSQFSVTLLKANLVDLVGIDERFKVQHGRLEPGSWRFPVDDECCRPIRANRISDHGVHGAVDKVASGANLDREHQCSPVWVSEHKITGALQ